MGEYETLQVCKNGHPITDTYESSPERRQDRCDKCGEETIIECQNCNERIRGDYQVDGVLAVTGIKDPADHCHNCGEPYPWNDETGDLTDVGPSQFDEELVDEAVDKYEDGHYQAAVQMAFVVLEERIRAESGFENEQHGTDLMTRAFRPNGPLAMGETEAEKEGTMLLYRGAMMALRNPGGHRFVDEIDEEYARDVLHTVNLLLRSVES
jgi:uncharacterized protein (TIGR02391 family)